MKINDIIVTANNNLFRNKTRTLLTTLAVIIGSITLLVAEGVGNGFEQYVSKNLETGSTQIFKLTKKGADNLKYGDITKYQEDSKLDSTQVFRASDVSYLKNTYPTIIKDVFYPQYLPFLYITRNDYEKFTGYLGVIYQDATPKLLSGKTPEFNQILISEDYIEPLGFLNSDDALGKVVTIRVWNNKQQFAKDFSLVISGVTHKSETTDPLQIDNDTATYIDNIISPESVNPQTSDRINIYTEKMSPSEITNFKDKLSNSGITASSYEDENKQIFDVVNGLKMAMMGVAAISLAVATFGIVNTVLMGILERTQEIGLMKALGGSKKMIFQLFTFEAICIGFWGYIISLILSLILGAILNPIASSTFLKNFNDFTLFVMTPFSAIKILLIVMTVSFGASFFPSLKASKLNPIEALRSE
jgi:putative ABC transport system permease protein